MSGGATAVMAAAAVASTVYTIASGERAASKQDKAQSEAKANALKQEKAAEEATNKANQKRPDAQGALDSAMQAGKSGASGTLLTGATGVDPATLQLGKTTLLGG